MWSWTLTSGEIFENPRLTWVWYLSRCFFSKTATSVWMNISQLIFYSWLKLTECWNCFIIVVVKLLLFFEKKIQKNVIQSNKLLLYIGLFWIGSIQEQLGPLHIFIFPQTVTVREFMSAASRKPASTLESLIGKCPAKSIAGNMWQLKAQRKTIVLWILRAWSRLSPEVISNFNFYCFTLFTSLSSPVDWIWQLMAPKIQWFTPSRMVNHLRSDWDSYEHSSLFWMSPASQTLFWSFDDNEPIVKTLLTRMMTRRLFLLQWYKTMTFYLNFVSSCYINTLSLSPQTFS